MPWLPAASPAVVNAADPPLSAAAPRTVEPSRNCTVPVAPEGDTVAVNVTDWPETDGFRDETMATVAASFDTVTFTAEDVLAASLASPLYAAVMLWVPAASVETESDAEPPL